MGQIEKGRWQPEPQEIIGRLDLADRPRFFDSGLIIDPGTWALLIDAGQILAELPPGVYTTANLVERGRQGNATSLSILLARQQDVYVQFNCDNYLTQDDLLVSASMELTLVIKDIRAVYGRLLGSRKSLTHDMVQQILLPLTKQLLLETMASFPLADVQATSARSMVEGTLLPKLNSSLNRFGLAVTSLRSWIVRQNVLDSYRQTLANKRAVAREQFANQEAKVELTADRMRLELQRREESNHLNLKAHQKANDRLANEVAVKMQRMQIRNELQQAMVDAQIDSWNAKSKLVDFRRNRDRENLLSDHEYQKYATELDNDKQQHLTRHANVMKQLEIQQAADLAGLRLELDFAHQREAHRAELELTRFVEENADSDWQTHLQREMNRAEMLHKQRLQEIELMREQTRAQHTASHDVDSQSLQQQICVERLRGDLRLTQEQQASRVRRVATETEQAIKDLQSEAEIRHRQRTHELHSNVLRQQLDALAQLNVLNQTQDVALPVAPTSTAAEPPPTIANASLLAQLAELNRRTASSDT